MPKSYSKDLGEDIDLVLMLIEAGEFEMGAPADEPNSSESERRQHRVKVPLFMMSRYPITQAQWRIVAGYDRITQDLDPDPSYFKCENRPVENVSWDDAQEFCQRLSAKSGKRYCLPSEAQWEYACRAETVTPFHYGKTITTDLANYNGTYTYNGGPEGEYRERSTDVGSFSPNNWGLCDMHGNVLEWCEDDWHDSYEGAPADGSAWIERDRTGTSRLLRGGCWHNGPANCRSASRNNNTRDNRNNNVGFRVCCVSPSTLQRQSWLVGISREYQKSPDPLLRCESIQRSPAVG